MTVPGETRWILPLPPAAPRRLICFPYAGGGASAYRRWPVHVGTGWQVCPVQLPGREERFGESPFTALSDLIPPLVDAVTRLDDGRPFAFFGHSMGALLAFEIARARQRAGMRMPIHVFVSGRGAPDRPSRREPLHALPDAAFLDGLRRLEGTPRAVLENQELMELLAPMLRADFSVVETYAYEPGDPLEAPITVFGGTEDGDALPDDLEAWRAHTRQFRRVRIFPGGHFYLHDHTAELAAELLRDLNAGAARA